MGLVVDTSAFVDVERSASAERLIEALREPLVMPAIVLAELLVGVQLARTRSRAARRQAQVDAFRARVPVVDFGPAVAVRWAELFASLRRAVA